MPHPPSAPSPEGEGLNKKASRFNRDAFFVHLKGVEPLTFSSVVRCSIQLSYRCIPLEGAQIYKLN